MQKKIYLLWLLITSLNATFCLAQQDTTGSNDRKATSYLFGRTVSLVLGGGIATPAHYGGIWTAESAPLFFVEPQFQVSPKLDLALRFEYAMVTTYRATYIANDLASVKGTKMPSVALFFDYRLGGPGRSVYRPRNSVLIGAGVGVFIRGDGALVALNNTVYPLGNCPGVIPRIGFSSRRILITAEYNLLWENQINGTFRSWLGSSGEFRGRNYASLKLGFKI